LDNCEHLIDPAARLVDRVLRVSPDVRVIATSREALDVDGEMVMPLRSMGVATTDALADISQSDAVKLFFDRATSARADFTLDSSNAATVNTICRRLDGIPLAIELAAVRVVSMSPAEIASLLDERFRLLTGGKRIALERHQTLRATVEWSYGLLEPHERVVFDRLAVFAGTFDGAAARGVVTDETVAEWDVIDALDGLVRKSLVIAETTSQGATRYQLLETLRQYARERLDERGETDLFRGRHAAYFAAFAEEVRIGLLGPDEFEWRARRDPELDNIRVAIAWAIDREDPDLITPYINSSLDEALVLWSKMGRPATRALPFAERFDSGARVSLLMLAALEAYMVGDLDTSVALAIEGDDLATDMQVTLLPGLLRVVFMHAFPARRVLARAIDVLNASPELLEQSGLALADQSRVYLAMAQYVLQVRGNWEMGVDFVDRGVALAFASRNPSSISMAHFTVGEINVVADPDRALVAFEQCVALHERGPLAQIGGAMYMSALLYAKRGDARAACVRLRNAIDVLYERGRSPELDGAFGYAVETFVVLEHPEMAAVVVGAVLDGVLQVLRDMPLPPGRAAPDIRAIRDEVGRDRFAALLTEGAAMSYDDLVAWALRSLDEIERSLPG
jgi:predicted ATPase